MPLLLYWDCYVCLCAAICYHYTAEITKVIYVLTDWPCSIDDLSIKQISSAYSKSSSWRERLHCNPLLFALTSLIISTSTIVNSWDISDLLQYLHPRTYLWWFVLYCGILFFLLNAFHVAIHLVVSGAFLESIKGCVESNIQRIVLLLCVRYSIGICSSYLNRNLQFRFVDFSLFRSVVFLVR